MTAYTETRISDKVLGHTHPLAARGIAHVLSYMFHPLFVPVYITCFLVFIHPLLFAGYDEGARLRLVATVFVNLTLLPAVTVFLCWRLKFINSLQMNTQKERIIPLAAAMIFYFWCWFVLKNFNEIPPFLKQFLLGSFITIIGGWLANIYFKVSLHALAMGGMVIFITLLVFGIEGGSAYWLAAALFVAGAVCSARLILSSHASFEIYAGFFIGVLSQLIAIWV